MTGAEEHRGADAVTSLVDLALESVGGERARLFLCDGDGLRTRVARNARKEDLPPDDADAAALAKRVVRERRSFALIDVRTPLQSPGGFTCRTFSFWDSKSVLLVVLAVPLRRGDRILGVLYVDAKARHKELLDEDLPALEAFADRLAATLEGKEAGP